MQFILSNSILGFILMFNSQIFLVFYFDHVDSSLVYSDSVALLVVYLSSIYFDYVLD